MLQSYLGDFFPLERRVAAVPKLEKAANLGLYTTPIAADDLDDVRAALGYDRLDLVGVSYGTRAALVYLRRHGDHVRTVDAPRRVAAGPGRCPSTSRADTERALVGVLGECAAEAGLSRRPFPIRTARADQD